MPNDRNIPTVNRYAVILEPTEAYLEWVRNCPGDKLKDLTLSDIQEEGTVHLIPEHDTELMDWLRQNFEPMFEEELEAWYTDDAFWPQDRSFKAFQKFFNIRFCSIVLDMGRKKLARDE